MERQGSVSEAEQERIVVVDIDVEKWTVAEARAYREAIGVNAEYALGQLQLAATMARDDARRLFGEAVDDPGFTPPSDWVPLSMLNVDPVYLCGFAWIAARRSQPELTYAELENELPQGQMMRAFYEALAASIAPLGNRAARRSQPRTPPTKTASRSATSTRGGGSKTSTA